MNPNIFTGKNVIIQGITGSQGKFHTLNMVAYGTNIVAGTSPNKAGTDVEGIPVYGSIKDIQQDFAVDISVIFVPAAFAKAAQDTRDSRFSMTLQGNERRFDARYGDSTRFAYAAP